MLPKSPPAWRRYLRFWGADSAADVDAELEFHLASRVDELMRQGWTTSDARAAALREFGDYAAVRREVQMLEQSYERRQGFMDAMADVGRDARHVLRSLGKSPAFTVVVVFTLSLGIGLNSTIFSLVNAYLFRPAPVPNGERLVAIGNVSPLLQQPHEVPYRDLQAYRELRGVFEDLTASVSYTESLAEGDRTERIWIERTTGNYFSSLRIPMMLGRGYTEDAGNRGERVVVLSHEFWSRRFAADSSIIGRTIRIEGEPRLVTGVASPSFHGFAPMIRSDAWSPIDETPAARRALMENPEGEWYNVYGVLRSGVSVDQARAAMLERSARLQKDFPSTNKDVSPIIVPETRARPAITIAAPIPVMAAVVLSLTLMVLAVACANVASLLLARGTTRHRELAVRAALGASRWRLARQAMLEAAILSLAGALGAVALARWSTTRLAGIHLATDAPLLFDFTPDWRVFAFTLGAALTTTLLAGLLPALRNASASPHAVLVAGGRNATDHAQQRVRSIIVVAQIAVSAIVVIAAGLFARSMVAAQKMELGFKTEKVLTAQFDLSLSRADSTHVRTFQLAMLQRARALPGVTGAALAARIPFGYSNNAQKVTTSNPSPNNPDGELIFQNVVTPDYFRTAGPPIIKGREFTESDNGSLQHVVVINDALARKFWPNEDPIGKILRVPTYKEELRVVGVARTAQYMFLGEPPRPFYWTLLAQHPRANVFLEVATTSAPEGLIPSIRAIARELDPNVPLFDVRSMTDHLRNGRALFAVRLGALFGSAFSLLAFALAMVGLYGLVSYSVNHRMREIGIRIAVGATTQNVVRMVLRQGLRLAVAGVALGAIAALAVTRLMSSLLYGVQSRDPVAFVVGPAMLGIISVVAAWLPARRAASMDPVRALKLD